MIPDEAVEAAVHAYMQYPRTRGLDNTANMFRAALEAAAPHMTGYKLPMGDDDNPHRDGDVQPSSHWLENRAEGWACSGCDWTGPTTKGYFDAHEKLDEYQVPF